MIILVGVAATVELGENGLIIKTRKETFYQEMIDLEEKKKVSNKYSLIENADEIFIGENIEQKKKESLEKVFLAENLTTDELEKLENTLKAEIIYVRNNLGDKEQLKTTHIWNSNLYGCQDKFSNSVDLLGMSKDIYYIRKDVTAKNKEKIYLYDRVSDVCFKIEKTKTAGNIVHSLPYAKLIIDGIEAQGVGIAEINSGTKTATDGTIYYEPDLNNFSYSTKIVYYSPDLKTEHCITLQAFIELGRPATLELAGKTYTFADYSTDKRRWANIKTTANGLDSYWVWIPRYAYALDGTAYTSDIIFVDINDKPLDTETYGETLPEGYVVHEAFKQKAGLKGIWFSKYDPSPAQTIPVDKINPASPNLANFNTESLKIVYYNSSGTTHEEAYNDEEFQAKFENGVPPRTLDVGGVTYYWYDYPTKKWANIKTTANELNSYWVWIPRFAYKLEIGTAQVILIDENDKPIDTKTYGEELPASFTVHEAFKQKEGLMGLWFSKYDPSKVTIETETEGTTEEETGEGETTEGETT